MGNIRISGDLFDVTAHGSTVAEGRKEWQLFASRENAGEAAREYWADMAKRDPREFRHMVGDETLVRWALGQYAGPGSTQVNSLEKWLNLWLDTPAEHFASYDGEEHDVEGPSAEERASEDEDTVAFVTGWDELVEELGFTPTVAYRSN